MKQSWQYFRPRFNLALNHLTICKESFRKFALRLKLRINLKIGLRSSIRVALKARHNYAIMQKCWLGSTRSHFWANSPHSTTFSIIWRVMGILLDFVGFEEEEMQFTPILMLFLNYFFCNFCKISRKKLREIKIILMLRLSHDFIVHLKFFNTNFDCCIRCYAVIGTLF